MAMVKHVSCVSARNIAPSGGVTGVQFLTPQLFCLTIRLLLAD